MSTGNQGQNGHNPAAAENDAGGDDDEMFVRSGLQIYDARRNFHVTDKSKRVATAVTEPKWVSFYERIAEIVKERKAVGKKAPPQFKATLYVPNDDGSLEAVSVEFAILDPDNTAFFQKMMESARAPKPRGRKPGDAPATTPAAASPPEGGEGGEGGDADAGEGEGTPPEEGEPAEAEAAATAAAEAAKKKAAAEAAAAAKKKPAPAASPPPAAAAAAAAKVATAAKATAPAVAKGEAKEKAVAKAKEETVLDEAGMLDELYGSDDDDAAPAA